MSDLPEVIVSQADELSACLDHLQSCPLLGFDTEFVGEDSYHPRVCLLQVATPDSLYLIDPFTTGPLEAFWRLLTDPERVVVVHAGREEVRLCRLWAGQPPANFFDLQIAAGLAGMTYPLGHGPLVGQLLRISLTKGETLTEWRHRPLTPAQLRYAFDDVRHLLACREVLHARLESLGRSDWAREEFARLALSGTGEETVVERWRKLRGLGSLDRRRLAVVRALYNWREEEAARTNRPTRSILRDDLIVEVARRGPTKERDLQVVRGVPRRDLTAIVEVVARARALPPEELPVASDREQDPPQVALVGGVLNAVLGDLCARMRLAPNLVANSTDVKLLVKARMAKQPPPAESMLTRGWRADHILPELLAVLDGQRSVRVANVRSDAPLAYGDGSRD